MPVRATPLILLSGNSGSGKTTIVNALHKQFKLTDVKSYTTRQKRVPNESGHTFITKEEFAHLDGIVARATIAGEFYGATQAQLDESDIYVVDYEGIETMEERYITERPLVLVFLDLSDEAFRRRVSKRSHREVTGRANWEHVYRDRILRLSDGFKYFALLDGERPVQESVDKIIKLRQDAMMDVTRKLIRNTVEDEEEEN